MKAEVRHANLGSKGPWGSFGLPSLMLFCSVLSMVGSRQSPFYSELLVIWQLCEVCFVFKALTFSVT